MFSHDNVTGDGRYFQGEKTFLFLAKSSEASLRYLKLYCSVSENDRLTTSTESLSLTNLFTSQHAQGGTKNSLAGQIWVWAMFGYL